MEKLARILKERLSENLPGAPAQRKMAPVARMTEEEGLKLNPNPKEASVLILLYPVNDIVHTVLIERNTYEGVHSGQIGFPGGRREATDATFRETALREAKEELGIQSNEVLICGNLSTLFIPPSGFLVQPVLGISKVHPKFTPEHREVKSIIEVPMVHFLNPVSRKHKMMKLIIRPKPVDTPYFDVWGHCVWGATAMMISELCAISEDLF